MLVNGDAISALISPVNWQNPKPASSYHLVVIGGGSAGLVAAIGAAGLGARVALVEKHRLGGDCLNSGCVPLKSFIAATRGMRGHEAGDWDYERYALRFREVIWRMQQQQLKLAEHDSVERLQSYGVDVFFGEAMFRAGENVVRVGDAALKFRKAVLCTGSRPEVPEISGLNDVDFLTTDSFFSLEDLPRTMVIVGGGACGVELGQAIAKLGTKVTILERRGRILSSEDSLASEVVQKKLVGEGIDVRVKHEVVHVEKRAASVEVIARCEEGEVAFECDRLLVVTGRVPNVEGMGLEGAGVKFDRVKGVRVDDFLRTTNRKVFAAGDVCSAHYSSAIANSQARMVLRNALFFGRQKNSRLVIPRCVFSYPEVAQVGLREEEAAASGLATDVLISHFDGVDRAFLEDEQGGFVKVVLKKGMDRILGATVVSPHAGELISEMTFAMATGKRLRQLGEVWKPYPTRVEIFRKLADEYQRTRLTKGVRRLLKRIIEWA